MLNVFINNETYIFYCYSCEVNSINGKFMVTMLESKESKYNWDILIYCDYVIVSRLHEGIKRDENNHTKS